MNNAEVFVNSLPSIFYPALLGELVSIFGPKIVEDLDGYHGYDQEIATGGWYNAFKQTCYKLDKMDIYTDYNEFDWRDSDEVDALICEHFDDLTEEDFHQYSLYCGKEDLWKDT